jgi:putative tricarboxylic transport membrane protein
MDLLNNLAMGFGVALSPTNVAVCFAGALIGTLIGVLPGLSPAATIAMLLPATFYLSPVAALIMLAGIYYGAQYGGSTTAILVRVPGEASSVVTCLDGHAMALNGRAGAALAIAALGSLFAGTVATLIISVASPTLSRFALQFGSAEYFSLMVFGLVGAVILAQGPALKAVAMAVLGVLLGLVGIDVGTGAARFTFGLPRLSDGIGFMPVIMGLFALADILANLQRDAVPPRAAVVGSLMPTREEFRRSIPAVLRGTGIGSLLGVLPGGGAMLSSFAAYAVEKKIARDPSRFGKGAVEGLAAPESANNAGAQTSFIPMLTLGLPSNPVTAMMIGALILQGIAPGPRIITDQPELFWGLIASMWIGNLMLVIINLPLIRIWVTLLKLPYRLLFPSIVLIASIGVVSIHNSPFDLLLMAGFGAVGYVFLKLNCEPAPLLLGFILAPLLEDNLRRALVLSRGDPLVFVERPISLTLLLMAAALVALIVLPSFRKTRKDAFVDG